MLFISVMKLGLRSNSLEMIRATEDRSDVDAVHVTLRDPTWLRYASANIPGPFRDWGGLTLPIVRRRALWSRIIGSWLKGPLSLDHFDAIHVITRSECLPVAKHLARVDPDHKKVLALAIDTTSAATLREFSTPLGWNISGKMEVATDQVVFDRSDLTLCRSNWCADSVVNDYGIDRSRTRIVYPSPSKPDRLRTPFAGDTERPFRIGFVGNTFQRKGGDRLTKWFVERWQDKAELHLVSKDAEFPSDAKNIHWHPWIERDKLINEFYPSLDVLVLPTQWDMITWALCEAASAGVAGVGPRMAGIPEAVLHEQSGLIIDDNDDAGYIAAVERMMADRDLTDRFGQAAAEHAEKHLRREVNYPPVIDRMIELADERA